jgi:Domain of unknown function (DUF4157)
MAAFLVVRSAYRRAVPAMRASDRRDEASASGMPMLYRAVALGDAAVDRDAVPGLRSASQPHDLEEQEHDRVVEVVMRSAERNHAEQPPVRPADARGGGPALDPADRTYFERRFGGGFGAVRVHSDMSGARNARLLSADAFTIGSDISFASGRDAPGTTSGRRLLAHELTHVVSRHGVRTAGAPPGQWTA